MKQQLTTKQRVIVADRFRENLPKYKEQRPNMDQVAAELGKQAECYVPKSFVVQLRKDFGDWRPIRSRSTAKRSVRILDLARIVERMAAEIGHKLTDKEQRKIDIMIQRVTANGDGK